MQVLSRPRLPSRSSFWKLVPCRERAPPLSTTASSSFLCWTKQRCTTISSACHAFQIRAKLTARPTFAHPLPQRPTHTLLQQKKTHSCSTTEIRAESSSSSAFAAKASRTGGHPDYVNLVKEAPEMTGLGLKKLRWKKLSIYAWTGGVMSVCLSQKPQTILLLVHLLFSSVCFICKACWISAFLPEPSWPPVDHRGITIMKGTADHSWSATWADVDNLSTKIEDGSTTPLRLNWLGLSPVQRLFKATLNLHQSHTHTHTPFVWKLFNISYFLF